MNSGTGLKMQFPRPVEVPRVQGTPATARGHQWSAAGHSPASQSSEGLERPEPGPTRVLVADDHAVVRQGLKFLLKREGFVIVAEAVDGRDALRQAQVSRPEVAVLDLSMPGMNGLDAAREIMQLSPETKTIVLTQHTEEQYVLEALRIGVHGYVLKSQGMSDMIQAIRDVQRGRFYLSPGISHIVIDAYREQNSPTREPLTAREREVLQLVAEGKSTKEVADILGITAKTAESHRSRLMLKLGVHDVAGLVRYAVRRGLVEA